MTQEFVTLPREVVERAIEALFCTDSEEGSTAYENELKAVKKLRAALEQSQANQPAMTPIAQRKLEDLMASGYTISGYSVYHERKHQHGFVTGAGLVGWWKPEGVEYPQPQGEQEPVAWLTIEVMGPRTRVDVEWEDQLQKLPSGIYKLYTSPQPRREPLTNEQISKIGREHEKFTKGGNEWFDRWTFARAIEAAHNIK